MNKSIYIIALSLLATVFSCNKAEVVRPEETGDLVTISAILPEDIDVKGAGIKSTLSWTWSANDEIVVIGETTEVFKIKDGFTPKKAEFVGKAVTGKTFTILYPGESAKTTDWTGQVQKGNDNLDHLRYEAALEGVDDYTTFSFSNDWAAAHGGNIKQTGVLKLVLSLPAEATSAIAASVSAEKPVFYSGNGEELTDQITLQMQDVTLDGDQLIAWATTSWNEAAIPAGTILTISVNTGAKVLSQEIVFAKETVLKSGMVNSITLGAKDWEEGSHYASGKGTAEKPWVIETVEQLLFVREDLLSGATRYFKLGADIDMKDVEWVPLNLDDPYDKCIDFNGNDHTISNFTCNSPSYSSFFGVLYGSVYDLKFENATVTTGKKSACGIVGGYCGTTGKPGTCRNVHVSGTVTSNAGANGVGGLFGRLNEGTVEKSSADCAVTSNANYAGGLFGYDAGVSHVSDCWTAGSVEGNQRIGGICGGLIQATSSIKRCYSTASVTCAFAIGGIAGHCNLDQKGGGPDVSDPQNVVEKCIAWNSSIKTRTLTPGATDHYSGGAVVGFTSIRNYLTDCIRKADLDFSDYTDINVPYDQENADPSTPLNIAVTGPYNYPYHGKAAAADATISSVAQALGWSAEIWDFSEDTPKLK